MKKVISMLSVLAFIVMASGTVQAEEGAFAAKNFSGSVTMVSDYLFRGVSQTRGDPAVQGTLDYAHPSGFYAGVFMSNAKFATTDIYLEFDQYVGFANTFPNSKLGYDISFLNYTYPGTVTNYDYNEVWGSLSYPVGPVNLKLGVQYANNYFHVGTSAINYELTASGDLPAGFSWSATVGRENINNEFKYGPDWNHYSVGISRKIVGFNVGVSYSDTNQPNAYQPDTGFGNYRGRFVFSIGRSL